MERDKGVQLLLDLKTNLPKWVNRKDLKKKNIKLEQEKNQTVYVLEIKGFEANFDIGGSVFIKKMPGVRAFNFWLPSLAVLEIRDLRGNLLKKSRFLCEKCFQNSGEFAGYKTNRQQGLERPSFTCSLCGHQWETKDQ